MVNFEVRLWLETHQLHAWEIEVLDFFHFLLVESNLLASKWVERANLVLVQGMSCLLTDHLGSSLERLVVHCVHLSCCWLPSRHYCGEETEPNGRSLGYFKLALALDPLFKFLLPNALHELKQPGLSPLYVQQRACKLILVEGDDVCVEPSDVELRAHLVEVRHSKQLNVYIQTCKVFGSLDGQVEIVPTSWHVAVCEDEYPLAKGLLLYLLEFLMAGPECLKQWRASLAH